MRIYVTDVNFETGEELNFGEAAPLFSSMEDVQRWADTEHPGWSSLAMALLPDPMRKGARVCPASEYNGPNLLPPDPEPPQVSKPLLALLTGMALGAGTMSVLALVVILIARTLKGG